MPFIVTEIESFADESGPGNCPPAPLVNQEIVPHLWTAARLVHDWAETYVNKVVNEWADDEADEEELEEQKDFIASVKEENNDFEVNDDGALCVIVDGYGDHTYYIKEVK